MKRVSCPACKGEKQACEFCGGGNLVTRRVSRAIKSVMGMKGSIKYPLQVIAGLRKVDDERAALAELPVPASFTGVKPATPESEAARRQALQVNGKWHPGDEPVP